MSGGGGLGDHCNRGSGPGFQEWLRSQPLLPGPPRPPSATTAMGAPAGDGGDLRMAGRADDDHRLPPRLLRLGGRCWWIRATLGQVASMIAPRAPAAPRRPASALAVGADDGTVAPAGTSSGRASLVPVPWTPDGGTDAVIVDEAAQHHAGLPGLSAACSGPSPPPGLHAVAEAGVRGPLSPCSCGLGSSRARMRSIRSSAMAWYSSAVPFLPATWG